MRDNITSAEWLVQPWNADNNFDKVNLRNQWFSANE